MESMLLDVAGHRRSPATMPGYHPTCASYLAAAGLTPKDVQTAMGHTNVATTLDLYAESVPGWERNAAARVDDCLDRRADLPRD
jgi:integrase